MLRDFWPRKTNNTGPMYSCGRKRTTSPPSTHRRKTPSLAHLADETDSLSKTPEDTKADETDAAEDHTLP